MFYRGWNRHPAKYRVVCWVQIKFNKLIISINFFYLIDQADKWAICKLINYQGTLIALASFSEGLQVDKLKSAALLSPIAYLSYMRTALGVIAAKSFVGEVTEFNEFHYRSLIPTKHASITTFPD